MTISVINTEGCPLAGANLAVMSILCTRPASTADLPVPVPAKNCRLIHVEAITTTVVATADYVIDLELNAASGSAIGTITIATSGSAIGTIDTLVWANMTQANAQNLSYDDANRDYINLELNGNAAAGACMLYLFFEYDT